VNGDRIGPYTLAGKLGEGGMGEVYRATDTRLKRQVAVKILPAAMAADPDRLARFQREAEVLASLNHPRIAAIYGLEESEQGTALVMELVEGPTLADRIAQGPIPIDEALPIARQIAEALEAAHDQGIVHRDLKPANIKVRDDGGVKVLDFGLAKLTEAPGAPRATDSSRSPTLASPAVMTGMGMILGTAAYMSPEQARGRSVDKRTDVWAFGAVLYEMLTGKRAFEGDDITDVLAEVVKSTPNWAALPAGTPPQVVTLVQQCLDKDRHARIGDIAVARFLLADPAATPAAAAGPVPAVSRSRVAIAWVAAALIAGAAIGWLLPRGGTIAPVVTHLEMTVSPAEGFRYSNASSRPSRHALALSPDGRTLVFAGYLGKDFHLYARGFDRGRATPIQGTEGAQAPFFSPDGQWIGFWSGGVIKKLPIAGGSAVTIADAASREGWGTSWGDDGTVVFAAPAGISKVSSAGATPVTVTTADVAKNERHLHPHLLPGGKHMLFTSVPVRDWQTAKVEILAMDTGERRVLIPGGSDARYVHTGHIVFMKAGVMMGVPFDLASRQLNGEPVTLIEDVMHAVNTPNTGDDTGTGQFAIAPSGTLVYLEGGVSPLLQSSWVWIDRKGVEEPITTVPSSSNLFAHLSPDGQRVASSVRRVAGGTSDVWVYDLLRGASTRLTFEGNNSWPAWSPDGKRLVYGSSDGKGAANLHVINADGSGKPERLTTSEFTQQPSSWAAGTNTIAFLQRPRPGVSGIWVLPMEGRQPKLFLESRFGLSHPEFSPDGRWLAYVSTESGSQEVYVQAYPGGGEKIRISTNGGMEPVWSANGRELFYRDGANTRVFAVAILSQSPFRADTPRMVFETKLLDSTAPIRSWSARGDGQRFLFGKFANLAKPITNMHVVLNWTETLKGMARGAKND
jgi:Tol biopolymer transport system component